MAGSPSRSVALEGPCCAGKTTLGHNLLGELSEIAATYVRDYSDFVGGGRFLPPPVPSSLAEEELSLNEFLRIEAARTEHAKSSPKDLILIDRSIHTLVAHCCGLKQKTGVDYINLAERVLAASRIPMWPDVVLYLDTPNAVATKRNKGKFAADSIFIDPNFNAGIREYFRALADVGSLSVIWLDATLDPQSLRILAGNQVREFLLTNNRGTGPV